VTKDELIAAQAMEIAELRETVKDRDERLRQIHLTCVCIGGPLNDNVLGYTREQLRTFHDIDALASI
jgi:hypothetical protein